MTNLDRVALNVATIVSHLPPRYRFAKHEWRVLRRDLVLVKIDMISVSTFATVHLIRSALEFESLAVRFSVLLTNEKTPALCLPRPNALEHGIVIVGVKDKAKEDMKLRHWMCRLASNNQAFNLTMFQPSKLLPAQQQFKTWSVRCSIQSRWKVIEK
ncbi:hypothetical protein MRB53_042251 [Persea americana]|nr:hypothetical protein MRB53_042251 [Persea americana]